MENIIKKSSLANFNKMLSLKQLVCFLLSLLSFMSVFYSVGKLGIFLATPSRAQQTTPTAFPSNRAELRAALFPLFFNLIWVVLFVLQHSAMRAEVVKRFWKAIGLELAERSLYNICSSYCVLLLLKNWQSPASQYRIWFFDVEASRTLWWVMIGSHVLSWIIIYGGSLMVDLPELIGLKHVYYDINDLAPPMSYKSRELQDYYKRYRHPSFIALSVVLWFTNGMTLDRCMLATVWSIYMFLAWNTTKEDLNYQRFQLDRKRAELVRHTGIFLNDESGLGKCFQVVAFLSATVINESHSLIICPTRERLHHWSYHIAALAPALHGKVHPKSYLEVTTEQATVRATDWQYVVVDETRDRLSEKQLETLNSLAVEKYIFVWTSDLLDQLDVLARRIEFCYPRGTHHLRGCIERQQKRPTKLGNFKLYLYTRRFILRRYARNYRRVTPLVARNDFVARFNAWKVANGIEAVPESAPQPEEEVEIAPQATEAKEKSPVVSFPCSGMTPEATVSDAQNNEIAATLHAIDSEPLFEPNETNTELMPVLRVDSDTPSESTSIPETLDNNGQETAPDSQGYIQFGQDIPSFCSSTQPSASLPMATERYRFPIEKFLQSQGQLKSSSSSVSVESLPNGQVPPTEIVLISSSESPLRTKSPPLFEESDHDTKSLSSSLSSEADDPFMLDEPPDVGRNRLRLASFSTPITKLMYGALAEPPRGNEPGNDPGDVSSVDMFAESIVEPPANDNVFEITKNNAFSNRIAVHGDDELRIVDDEPSDDDSVQFVNETKIDRTIDLVVVDTPNVLNRAVVFQSTPPSAGHTGNQVVSPGRGWLGKSLRAGNSPGSTPSTSRHSPGKGGSGGMSGVRKVVTPVARDSKRRRKLEELFQNVDDRGGKSQRKGARGMRKKAR
uniref:Nuclear envelope membrane protein n=1 Tax=Anopheles farauti TaxID=69004 RepID=A0A182QQB6_9DIPT